MAALQVRVLMVVVHMTASVAAAPASVVVAAAGAVGARLPALPAAIAVWALQEGVEVRWALEAMVLEFLPALLQEVEPVLPRAAFDRLQQAGR
jgi:hypothetical protein